ncbi:MAG: protein kinase [Planctomycetota bacterium]|nr:protein kinase [Planctomycetota bacterium]
MDRVGPYVIDRKIGTGGMGTVYLASHEATGETAAVKVLPASLAREEGFLARFEREISALRQLDNPHVVRVFDSGSVGEDDGDGQAYYYAMEYVEGETLLTLLRRERRLPWPTVIDYGVQVCSALKAAHDAGIVHRDLKPSNLLISKDGNVKLADFGVAQVFASTRLTKTGGIIGTAEFMSPEQAQGHRSTKKSDLYSLGAVLYTMLAGKPPYSGQTMLDVLHKHRFGQYDRPRHYATDCPSWLEEIVVQLLEKDPDKRPSDAYVTGKRLREVIKKVELSQSEPMRAQGSNPSISHGPPTGQEILSNEDESGHADDYAGDLPTRTAYGTTDPNTPAGPRGPGEATLMHALMREELARQQERHPVQKLLDNTWVLLALLVLLMLGGWYWYQNLPTPESHFADAQRLLAEPAGPGWTTARLKHLKPLLEEGGEWREKAEPLVAMVENWEDEQRAAAKASKTRASSDTKMSDRRPAPVTATGEAGRLLQTAQRQRDRGDVAAASETLKALIAVTRGDETHAAEHALAARMLNQVEEATAEATKARSAFIESALERAEALERDGDREDAAAVYRGLLTLYGDEPELADLLEPARKTLADDPQ